MVDALVLLGLVALDLSEQVLQVGNLRLQLADVLVARRLVLLVLRALCLDVWQGYDLRFLHRLLLARALRTPRALGSGRRVARAVRALNELLRGEFLRGLGYFGPLAPDGL